MTVFVRKLAYSVALACLALALGATPADARAAHHKHHVKTHHVSHKHARGHAKASRGSSIVRIAQEHLSNLGYYDGKADGVMGPKTKAAIKRFQREHGIKADGALGAKTVRALSSADHRVIGTHSMPLTRENAADAEVNQDFAVSLGNNGKMISSRFARVDVNESGEGANKRYSVELNGQSILTADGQPSVVGISPTYDMGNEDAVVFTTFSPNNTQCIYKNHVLALNGAGTKMLDIENCTRDYEAKVNNGSLYISFPEHDDNRALGATWRLEGTTLERM